jgi:hypothetical protein
LMHVVCGIKTGCISASHLMEYSHFFRGFTLDTINLVGFGFDFNARILMHNNIKVT